MLGRVSEQAAAVIYNSTRVRADRARVAHRSADRPAEPPLARPPVRGRAGARRRAPRRAVSVVVLDLDRLKEINDTYGHEAGDRALRAVGNVAASHGPPERPVRAIRGRRVHRRAVGLQPRARSAAGRSSCRTRSRRTRSSRGRASASRCRSAPAPRGFPMDGTTFDELLAAADERMYRDKAGRRSRSFRPAYRATQRTRSVVACQAVATPGAVRLSARFATPPTTRSPARSRSAPASTARSSRARRPARTRRARSMRERAARTRRRAAAAPIPFDIANSPCCQCTLTAATIITGDHQRRRRTGRSRPRAMSTPPPTPLTAAAAAKRRPGGTRGPRKPCRAVEPVAAEPAEELLRPMRRHQDPQRQPGQQQSCVH